VDTSLGLGSSSAGFVSLASGTAIAVDPSGEASSCLTSGDFDSGSGGASVATGSGRLSSRLGLAESESTELAAGVALPSAEHPGYPIQVSFKLP
jgi:hypothetical protein